MSSKIEILIKVFFFVLISFCFFLYDVDSFSQEKNLSKKAHNIIHLCPSTKNIVKFNWLKKFFHRCQTFTEGFNLTNECYEKYPFKVSMDGTISLSNKGIEFYLENLKLTNIPESWGNRVFIGFKVFDKNKDLSFKVKEYREIKVELINQQFLDKPKKIMTIYGPQREGGQDEYENLIENELEELDDRSHFRFYLTISSEDRDDALHLPGPILKDLPSKIKQRNTCQ